MSIAVVRTVAEIRSIVHTWKKEGLRVGLVPTMGYLHQGHLALVDHGLRFCDRIVMSIFVNPTQFGPNEDFDRYPRDEPRDREMAEEAGVSVLFCPHFDEMYPSGAETYVSLERLPQHLCGPLRPGHFRGVATICTKLFVATEPDVAIFGEKDYQQATIIRKMASDLLFPIQIETAPTVREPDGLAMSSRNVYLTAEERRRARCVVSALDVAEGCVRNGVSDVAQIRLQIAHLLDSAHFRVDYIAFVHPQTLENHESVTQPTVLAIAGFIGKTRLIDNRLLVPAHG